MPHKTTSMKRNDKRAATIDKPIFSGDNDVRLERLVRKGFIVDGDGCVLPKKSLTADPKKSRSCKRPRGASPDKYERNPIRGIWEPNGTRPIYRTPLMPERMTNKRMER
jgi:hypothetical protein